MNVFEKVAQGLYTFKDEEQFRNDLFAYFNVQNHPRAEIAYGIAWEHGHSYGYREVCNYFIDLLPLVQD